MNPKLKMKAELEEKYRQKYEAKLKEANDIANKEGREAYGRLEGY